MKRESVEAIVQALNQANVRYLIVGGLAVVAHGYEDIRQLDRIRRRTGGSDPG